MSDPKLPERIARLEAQAVEREKAVDRAVTSLDRELGHLNELRRDVVVDRNQFVLRAENDVVRIAQDQRLSALADRVNAMENRKKGLEAGWAYLIAAAGAVVGIVSLVYVIAH